MGCRADACEGAATSTERCGSGGAFPLVGRSDGDLARPEGLEDESGLALGDDDELGLGGAAERTAAARGKMALRGLAVRGEEDVSSQARPISYTMELSASMCCAPLERMPPWCMQNVCDAL